MSKINKGYRSLLAFLAEDYEFAANLNDYFNPTEQPIDERYNPENQSQLLGSLQPFADMVADARKTFKPYKSKSHLNSDLATFLRGLRNIGTGLATVVGATVLFFVNFAKAAFTANSFAHFGNMMRQNAINTLSWLVNGIANIIRGVTQLVASPFAMARVAIRGRQEYQHFHQNKNVHSLVDEATRLASEQVKPNTEADFERQARLTQVLKSLDWQYAKACFNGQTVEPALGMTAIPTVAARGALLEKALTSKSEADVLKYVSLFREDHTFSEVSMQASTSAKTAALLANRPKASASSFGDELEPTVSKSTAWKNTKPKAQTQLFAKDEFTKPKLEGASKADAIAKLKAFKTPTV